MDEKPKLDPIIIPESYKYLGAFLTMRCNLNCSFCLNAFDKSFDRKGFQEISGDQWIEGLNRIQSRPDVPVTLSGGEPSLHKDFIQIIRGIKPTLNRELLTNLQWSRETLERFLDNVNPAWFNRDSKYPAIRASYHPEQMGEGKTLLENALQLQNKGFRVGIYSVQHPSSENLQAITQMQFRCRDAGIDFRLKDFTGKFAGKDDFGNTFELTYGNYSKYPGSVFQDKTKECLCKPSELLIGPNGDVYRCHRDLFVEEHPVGNIWKTNYTECGHPYGYQITPGFRGCDKFGQCHPCDVKSKTNNKQQLGHTSVEIKDIRE
jgi:radical SAM protein with 4Fe4S-binding SPASM domain